MQRVRLESGIELYFITHGEGPPLVLLHGGTGDLHSWPAQMRELGRRYRVIAYSRRYNYPNRNPFVHSDYSALVDAGDLAQLIRLLRLGSVRLLGTSYGALVALAFAARQPDSVRSLVCVEPPVHTMVARAVYRRFLAGTWRPAADSFKRGHVRDAMSTLVDGMWGRPIFARLPREARATIMRNAPAMQALARSSNPFPRLRGQLARVRMPVLLVDGARSSRIHRLGNRALARLLPDACAMTIPRTSHGVARENSRDFNRVALAFLQFAEEVRGKGTCRS